MARVADHPRWLAMSRVERLADLSDYLYGLAIQASVPRKGNK
jgi:hypothetical protein